jgi:hypothetical protein
MHDLIGDIHGHADALLKILRQLGRRPLHSRPASLIR